MKKIFSILTVVCLGVILITSCGGEKNEKDHNDTAASTPDIREENVSYTSDTVTMKGFVAYDANKKEKLPVILIVHEWWGLNDYIKSRARQLAELGYFAMAVDMYGNGQQAADPQQAQALATPFYENPQEANKRMEAAREKIKSYDQADTGNTVAIGYCFGGSMVLNAARSGMDLDGVVSFHGGLAGVKPHKGSIKADILVCHGAADQFVPKEEVTRFKMQMDSVGAKYIFKEYASATHAFTNPQATENGKKFNIPIAYNEKADKDSWKDFMDFLDRVLEK